MLCLLLSFTPFHLLSLTIQIYSLPPGVMAYSNKKKQLNKQRGNMLNILAGITLCFLNVLFLFCFKCFGIYSVIIYALIPIDQI